MPVRIGVLALQGDFEAHRKAIERAGGDPVEVRTAADLDGIDGLIIPGGESTTILNLLEAENLLDPIRFFGSQRPIFGTCAGAILMASAVSHPDQPSLGLMDLTVERNGYGRQVDSRIVPLELDGKMSEAVFIRAPIIRGVGPGARVLASFGGTPVLVEQGRHLASTFHPELSSGSTIHRRFVEKILAEKMKTGAKEEKDSVASAL